MILNRFSSAPAQPSPHKALNGKKKGHWFVVLLENEIPTETRGRVDSARLPETGNH
jgi:hypothetical protein